MPLEAECNHDTCRVKRSRDRGNGNDDWEKYVFAAQTLERVAERYQDRAERRERREKLFEAFMQNKTIANRDLLWRLIFSRAVNDELSSQRTQRVVATAVAAISGLASGFSLTLWRQSKLPAMFFAATAFLSLYYRKQARKAIKLLEPSAAVTEFRDPTIVIAPAFHEEPWFGSLVEDHVRLSIATTE